VDLDTYYHKGSVVSGSGRLFTHLKLMARDSFTQTPLLDHCPFLLFRLYSVFSENYLHMLAMLMTFLLDFHSTVTDQLFLEGVEDARKKRLSMEKTTKH
jgi:hypothetical protein